MEFVRECWRIIPIVFIEIYMVIEVLVIVHRQHNVVNVIEFFK